MELVAAGLRDDVDHAAERPAVLGLVAAGLDLDLLDELAVDGLALEAFDDVGRVDAVDDVLVLDGCRAVYCQRERASLRLAPVGVDARVRPDDIGVVAGHGQARDDLRRVVRAGRRGIHIHQRRLAADRHRFRRRELQGDVHRRGGVERDDRRLLDGARAGERSLEPVGARRNGGNPVVPVRTGDDDPRALKVRARGLDRDAGKRLTLRIVDGSLDVSQGLGENEGRRQDQAHRGDPETSIPISHEFLLPSLQK